jgi:hypothetical protein
MQGTLLEVTPYVMQSGDEVETTDEVMQKCREQFLTLFENKRVVEPGLDQPTIVEFAFTWHKTSGFAMFFYRRGEKLFVRRSWEYKWPTDI